MIDISHLIIIFILAAIYLAIESQTTFKAK